jgi:hypothetical protein
MASAKSTKEAGALKSVLQAYILAATDQKGEFIDGYSNNQSDTFTGPNGEEITWPASGRYVWRILPYLDNALTSLLRQRTIPMAQSILWHVWTK